MAWEKLTQVLVRHWMVVLIGAACTMGVALLVVRDDGVYFSRTYVTFLAPTSTNYPNALRTQSVDVIDTAGVVGKRISGPGRVTKFASPDVTLVGLGVRDGWSLQLPDTGGQWATNFATQTLVLDVVGPSREVVQERQEALVVRIQQELNLMQRDAGVNPRNDITAIPAPQSVTVHHVAGSRPRALGMAAVLGVGVTAAAVLALERRAPRPGRRLLGLRRPLVASAAD